MVLMLKLQPGTVDIFLEGRLLGVGLIGLEVPTAQSYVVAGGIQVPCWQLHVLIPHPTAKQGIV